MKLLKLTALIGFLIVPLAAKPPPKGKVKKASQEQCDCIAKSLTPPFGTAVAVQSGEGGLPGMSASQKWILISNLEIGKQYFIQSNSEELIETGWKDVFVLTTAQKSFLLLVPETGTKSLYFRVIYERD